MDQPNGPNPRDAAPDPALFRRLNWAALCLGVALGGFFDGILLHQILQWHHLLSGVAPTGTVPDLRFQILADGLFHMLHYLLAVVGLGLLWAGRGALGGRGGDRRLAGFALIGFGGWHIADAVLAHWLLQLHRIRMDVPNPLLWDLLWLVPFGILATLLGFWLLGRVSSGGGSAGGRPGATVPGLALGALIAGPIAALPPTGLPEDEMTLAVFRPGLGLADIVAAVDAVDGRLVWSDGSGGVWLIVLGPESRAATLYRHGALMVSNGPVAAGCLAWTEL